MNRGTIQKFLESVAGTADEVFGETVQRVARKGGAMEPDAWMHLRCGVDRVGHVGVRRARPRGARGAPHPRFLPPAVDQRKEPGGRRREAGR